MKFRFGGRLAAVWLWLAAMTVCAVLVSRASFTADMSAFRPPAPTPEQQRRVDQLRDGLVSRLILVGIEGVDAPARAALSRKLGDRLIATAPPTIAGKLEIRGIGIVDMPTVQEVRVALLVELTSDVQRLPDDSRERPVLGIKLPLVSVDAMSASAASKVALALDRLGLKS